MTFSATLAPGLSIERVLHPVGQGAFYSESFLDQGKTVFTAVYDCGGYKVQREKEINKLAKNINFLFVSHFHADHINGIEFLLSKRTVERVIFPIISPCRFLVDFIRNCTKGDQPSLSFMYRVIPALKSLGNGTEVGGVRYIPRTYGSNKYPIEDILEWEYVTFYNKTLEQDKAEAKLLEKLTPLLTFPYGYEDGFLTDEDYRHIAETLANDPELIKEVKLIYSNTIPGGHNAYSMLVLSHEKTTVGIESHQFDCLYTGDIKVDDSVLDIASKHSPDYIQVPHHGSKYSNDDRLYSNKQEAFISVGENNRYRHPAVHVVKHIMETCKRLTLVTENESRPPLSCELNSQHLRSA